MLNFKYIILTFILLLQINCYQKFSKSDLLKPRVVENGVRFSFEAPFGAKTVSIAGDFNGWNPDSDYLIDPNNDNIWYIILSLEPNKKYEYKFVVDGKDWFNDPYAKTVNPNIPDSNNVFSYQLVQKPYVKNVLPLNKSYHFKKPNVSAILVSQNHPIDISTIKVSVDNHTIPHSYFNYNNSIKATLSDSLPNGKHTLNISFSDQKNNEAINYEGIFYFDDTINDINTPTQLNGKVMYEIFIRSFRKSDNRSNGTFKGIIEKLDYLNDGNPNTDEDLGIDIIWLMPFHPSPSYHGYDVTDYFNINPDYGTMQDYIKFVKECHKRDISVIMDLVINHCSNKHPYFIDAYRNPQSKYTSWFKFHDKANLEYGAFGNYNGMPELNYYSDDIREWTKKIASFWIDPNNDGNYNDGVDGFRLDVATGPPYDYWKEFRKYVKSYRNDLLILGEVWKDFNTIKWYYDEQFDMVFDYPFYYDIQKTLYETRTYDLIENYLNKIEKELPDDAMFLRFLANHDNHRSKSLFYNDIKKLKIANILLFTLSGLPMIYYGDEIEMIGKKPPDKNVRKPFDWNLLEEKRSDTGSLFYFYKKLIYMKHKYNALHKDHNRKHISYKDRELYIFVKEDEIPLLIITNLSDKHFNRVTIKLNKYFSNSLKIELKPVLLQNKHISMKLKNNELYINTVYPYDYCIFEVHTNE